MSENVEIINGIDVSECELLQYNYYPIDDEECAVCLGRDIFIYKKRCLDNPDCYYKQLQREKQKNEKLKKALNNIDKHIYNFCKNCDLNKTDLDCTNHCWFTEIATPICESIKEVENERHTKNRNNIKRTKS